LSGVEAYMERICVEGVRREGSGDENRDEEEG
jgi:hypothetical protein